MPTNINTSNNTVVIQPTNYTVTVTNNNVGSTTNVTNPYTTVINVASLGPQGIPGVQGVPGDSVFSNLGGGVFATTSSIQVTGSFTVSGSSTFTNIGPAVFSGSTAISGTLTVNGYDIVTVNQTSSLTALSASHAATASYLNTLNQNLTFNGNLTLNGTASIAYLNVQYESASIIYSSGSNQLGDAANDTQTLYGSVIIPTGSLTVSGSIIASGSDATINSVRVGRGSGNIITNTALGADALSSNTVGSENTAIGRFTMFSNTTGTSNTAVGVRAIQSNIGGSSNVGLGYQAGRFITDGTTALTASNNSVFLGANTKALANSQTNQIVIGYDAIGLGSNSVVLGNSSITLTALRGNVLINTTTDAGFGLDVSGSGRFTNNLTVTGSTTITGEANVSFLSLGGNTALNNSSTTMILGASGAWAGVRIPKNLEVTGSAIISSSANTQLQVGSNFLFVSSSGNVGIGTIAPAYKLDVSGSAKINDGIFGLGTTGNILPLFSPAGTGTVVVGGTSPNIPALRFQGSPLNFFYWKHTGRSIFCNYWKPNTSKRRNIYRCRIQIRCKW